MTAHTPGQIPTDTLHLAVAPNALMEGAVTSPDLTAPDPPISTDRAQSDPAIESHRMTRRTTSPGRAVAPTRLRTGDTRRSCERVLPTAAS
jgi:hypothetical protein